MTDVKLAVRTLRRSPAFTVIAVLTMAVAIGANSAMFAVFDRLVLNAVTVPNASSLLALWVNNPQRNIQTPSWSVPRYQELTQHGKSFASLGLSAFDSFTLTGRDTPVQLTGLRVSASFLPTLGVMPAHGRNFTPEEDTPNGPNVCIISHELWQSRFGGRSDLLNQIITLNGGSWQVVGIMAPGLSVPFAQTQVFAPRVADVGGLTPQQVQGGAGFAQPIARLKPGVSLQQAAEELVAFSQGYRERHPGNVDANNISEPRDFVSTIVSGLQPTMYTLLGAVACVLLITMANVASLYLTRLIGRRKEVALRLSLGAGRAVIIRQCLIESAILALAAGLLGAAIGWGGVRVLQSVIGGQLPPNTVLSLSWPTILFTTGISALSAVFIGLFPALQASKPDLVDHLKDSARGSSSAGTRLRQALIVVEVSLSVVLLVGAGLLLRTFARLSGTELGFEPVEPHFSKLVMACGFGA